MNRAPACKQCDQMKGNAGVLIFIAAMLNKAWMVQRRRNALPAVDRRQRPSRRLHRSDLFMVPEGTSSYSGFSIGEIVAAKEQSRG